MKRVLWTVLTAASTASLAFEATASGVGASIYVERPAGPAAGSCPTGGCAPVASCPGCQRLGFACVDHATPAPCTAEGGCYPQRPTWGWHKTNWRRWPGTEVGGPAPEPAGQKDPLVPPFEEPAPEDEDVQAPLPIEEEGESSEEGEEPGSDTPAGARPGVDINLPALPEPRLPRPGLLRPGTRPGAAPAGEDAPPALPFGFRTPAAPGSQSTWAPPQPPLGGIPASLPKPAADTPPPLPQGFTAVSPAATPRRLPSTFYINDQAVQPASASLPASVPFR